MYDPTVFSSYDEWASEFIPGSRFDAEHAALVAHATSAEELNKDVASMFPANFFPWEAACAGRG